MLAGSRHRRGSDVQTDNRLDRTNNKLTPQLHLSRAAAQRSSRQPLARVRLGPISTRFIASTIEAGTAAALEWRLIRTHKAWEAGALPSRRSLCQCESDAGPLRSVAESGSNFPSHHILLVSLPSFSLLFLAHASLSSNPSHSFLSATFPTQRPPWSLPKDLA